MTDVTIPSGLWDEDREAAISAWLYDDGDVVAEGAVIAEIMVEKTSHDLVAPVAGRLERLVEPEQPLAAGQIVARLL